MEARSRDLNPLRNLRVVQDTPAAVGVSGAQTLGTRRVLLAGLHRNLSHLVDEGQSKSMEGNLKIHSDIYQTQYWGNPVEGTAKKLHHYWL